ncbi:MAG: HDOD domain-containing protein [Deltaproteobacteria bacterium]|nr:HDOD domain-containing protein [Deltaproteobacteria bacterium]
MVSTSQSSLGGPAGDPPRALFVDDEPQQLRLLRRLLPKTLGDWHLCFSEGGAAAIAELERTPFDLVVSDLNMPDVDGVSVLTFAKEHQPQAARVALSGAADAQMALRLVLVAHQYLAKPIDGPRAAGLLERTWRLHGVLNSATLRKVVGAVEQLPALPQTFAALTETLSRSRVTVAEVVAVLERDPSVAAKVLQLVSSAFFGRGTRGLSLDGAVTFLGFGLLRSLVLMLEVTNRAATTPVCGVDVGEIQAHALLSARIARELVQSPTDQDAAFAGALLHDIGALVFSTRPARHSRQPPPGVDHGPCHPCGSRHGPLGAYLLGTWGLSYDVVEAVALFEEPFLSGSTGVDVLAAVHAGHVLADWVTYPTPHEAFDEAYIERIGAKAELPRWEALARRIRDRMT